MCMNVLMVIDRITTKLNTVCDRIRACVDYDNARRQGNYGLGLVDALIMMDWDNGSDDDLTQLAFWYRSQIYEAMIFAAMETKQDCSVILKLMEKRDEE